jgi:geranylgeranyl pyrophosphate synthase
VTRDYVNCFVDPYGGDIKDGRITWLAILARQRANAGQLATLEQCYGKPEAEAVAEVKRIYKELNLNKNAKAHMNETRDDIMKHIQQESILRNTISAENFSDKSLSLKFWTNCHKKQLMSIYPENYEH